MRSVVIIGGGISGLSTAYHLSKAGIPCTLVERRPYLGGVIRTDSAHGCVLEAGPDSFLSAKPWALELIRELGLAGEVIGSNDQLRVTYVVKGGKLLPLPDGLMLMVPTRILPMVSTRLLGWPTKFRMGWEVFRRPGSAQSEDRSVADFIRDHYGEEAVDYLAEPLLAGVYGGDPEKLSVSSVLNRFVELEEKYGSLSRGVLVERRKMRKTGNLPLFQTLRGGLGKLITALVAAAGHSVKVIEDEALTVERQPGGYRVVLSAGSLDAGHVILACQAHEGAGVIRALDTPLADLLAAIPYNSSITVSLGYEKRTFDCRLNGFGFLVPKRERKHVVACTWVGTKFDHRVPEDKVVLRCFLGGGDRATLRETDDALVETVRQELCEIMGVHAQPIFWRVARWPRSMAQYTVGHQKRVEEIETRLSGTPGVHLVGNAYYGIGIPDCVRMGKQVAERIATSR
jgi:protoporphyrinogen/coproporphyrinogen III oxidase